MSEGENTRFRKGQSGNPKGRPRLRRAEVSAFDVVLDKTLTVTQQGVTRELTIDEALQLQTYQSALQDSRMAIRAVLRMIEQREVARARRAPARRQASYVRQVEYDAGNADAALQILGIAEPDGSSLADRPEGDLKLHAWVAEAALRRGRGSRLTDRAINLLKRQIMAHAAITWPASPGR